MNPVSI